MRTTLLAIVAGAGLLFSAAAMADPSAANLQTASTSESPRLVCHLMVHEGMLVPTATQCRTQRYWDQIRYREQQAISDWERHSYQMPLH